MTTPEDQKREDLIKHFKELNKDKDTTKLFFDLTADEAKALLMTSAHYHNFEMPEYFNFDNVLNHVQNTVGNRPYTECLHQSIDINSCNGVNIDILLNKDGHYAVRPSRYATRTSTTLWYAHSARLRLGKAFHRT